MCSLKFLSSETALYLCKSTIRPCMDTANMSELVLLILTLISSRNGYIGLLVLYLLRYLNPWRIVSYMYYFERFHPN